MTTTRFAPSPTGFLHLGHAYSALFSAEKGQQLILRIEDIDPTRCRPEYIEAIYQDLRWLGLSWSTPVRCQSNHMQDYQAALDKLDQLNLLYPCFCTRKEIQAELAKSQQAPHGPDGALYPQTCRSLSSDQRAEKIAQGLPYALRLDMAKACALTGPLFWQDVQQGRQQATPEIFGDVVLARKDTPTSYHLAVCVDDNLQGIDLVTRGQDLFFASHLHRLLQALLQLQTLDYHHHPLLRDETGKRYAKRDKALTLRQLRDQGYTPDDILHLIKQAAPEALT